MSNFPLESTQTFVIGDGLIDEESVGNTTFVAFETRRSQNRTDLSEEQLTKLLLEFLQLLKLTKIQND